MPPSSALIPTLLISSGRSRISFLVSLPLDTAILTRRWLTKLPISSPAGESIRGISPYYLFLTTHTSYKLYSRRPLLLPLLTISYFRRIGYFTLNNTSNNNIAIEALGKVFSFNYTKRQIRYVPYYLNLVVKAILYSSKSDNII